MQINKYNNNNITEDSVLQEHNELINVLVRNLVNESNLVHDLFLVYFVNFIYNLYMFRTSPCPSSGETTVFMRHFVPVILYS